MNHTLEREHFSDTFLSLSIETILFGILQEHIDDDFVPFSSDDFERMRIKIINGTGEPVEFNFSEKKLENWLIENSQYFTGSGNKHVAIMEKILREPNQYRKEEVEFCLGNETWLRKLLLFGRLDLDERILGDPFLAYALGISFMTGEGRKEMQISIDEKRKGIEDYNKRHSEYIKQKE